MYNRIRRFFRGKIQGIFIAIMLYSGNVYSNDISDDISDVNKIHMYENEEYIQKLTKDHGLYLKTKSIKGWIRLFNNDERLEKRNYMFGDIERRRIKKYLKMKQTEKMDKHNRSIK